MTPVQKLRFDLIMRSEAKSQLLQEKVARVIAEQNNAALGQKILAVPLALTLAVTLTGVGCAVSSDCRRDYLPSIVAVGGIFAGFTKLGMEYFLGQNIAMDALFDMHRENIVARNLNDLIGTAAQIQADIERRNLVNLINEIPIE